MPRKPRNISETQFSHVIIQGLNKDYIFAENCFKKLYLNLLDKYKQEFESNIEILAYCIMDNHAHLLIYSPKIEILSNFMQKINTCFAKRYNAQKSHTGYVFSNRFFTQSITSETQLFNCLVYIHRNPIHANMVSHYEDYPFSSYNEFINKFDLITPTGCKLIFGTSENYLNTFKKIHEDRIIEDIIDIPEYIEAHIIIKLFLETTRKDLETIKKDKILLKDLLVQLIGKSNLSLRKIATLLKISRNTILNLLN